MRFVGQTEVVEFLSARPSFGSPVRAWVSEVKYRTWDDVEALRQDFGEVDVSAEPVVVFYLRPAILRIDTVIDFRRSIVVLTAIDLTDLAKSTVYGTALQ